MAGLEESAYAAMVARQSTISTGLQLYVRSLIRQQAIDALANGFVPLLIDFAQKGRVSIPWWGGIRALGGEVSTLISYGQG
jgi:hypothetical protein